MRKILLIILILLGIYWLVDHSAPLPLNHDQFGLHEHTIHRIMGIIFLLAAGVVWWKGKKKIQ